MTDAELTQALRHIGVDRRTLRALPLLPLVQVAWADGRVQPAERGLILEVASRYGLGGAEVKLLDRWLEKRPEDADFLLARQVLLVLWSRDRERGQAPESLDGVIRMCMCVARVAGGLFGLAFTMDPREREMIGEISQSLQLGPTLTAAARAAIASEPRTGRSIADDETKILPRRRRPRTGIAHVETPLTSKRLAHPPAPSPDESTERDLPSIPEAEEASSPAGAAGGGPKRRRPFDDGPSPRDRYRRGPGGETLLPPDEEETDSSTVPLASLKRLLEEEEETEVDIPMLPQDYDFDLD
jgi:tellurite resistance protein